MWRHGLRDNTAEDGTSSKVAEPEQRKSTIHQRKEEMREPTTDLVKRDSRHQRHFHIHRRSSCIVEYSSLFYQCRVCPMHPRGIALRRHSNRISCLFHQTGRQRTIRMEIAVKVCRRWHFPCRAFREHRASPEFEWHSTSVERAHHAVDVHQTLLLTFFCM